MLSTEDVEEMIRLHKADPRMALVDTPESGKREQKGEEGSIHTLPGVHQGFGLHRFDPSLRDQQNLMRLSLDSTLRFFLWSPTVGEDRPSNPRLDATGNFGKIAAGLNRRISHTTWVPLLNPGLWSTGNCEEIIPFSVAFYGGTPAVNGNGKGNGAGKSNGLGNGTSHANGKPETVSELEFRGHYGLLGDVIRPPSW